MYFFITLSRFVYFTAAFIATFCVSQSRAASSTEQPIGWASEQGGTTGGRGGTVVTVDNIDSLIKVCQR